MKKEITKHMLIKASEDYLAIWKYIADLPNGAMVEYSQIEKDLCIEMDSKGRAKLFRACKSSGREYKLIKNVGYKFADGKSAMEIVNHGINKVGNSLERLKHTQINIKIDIYEDMSSEDKREFNFKSSVTNAILESVEGAKRLNNINKSPKLAELKPMIPEENQ